MRELQILLNNTIHSFEHGTINDTKLLYRGKEPIHSETVNYLLTQVVQSD